MEEPNHSATVGNDNEIVKQIQNLILENVSTNHKLDTLVTNLMMLQGDVKKSNKLLDEVSKTVHCFKMEHRSHRGWGKKVTLFTIALAVFALGVEVATKGEVATFSVAWHYMKGLWL